MNDFIVRFDGFGKVDKSRTHEITPDKTFDNKRLNREKLKELIEANDPVITWLEHGLKYALRYYESVRNSGASDLVTLRHQDSFDDLWITDNATENRSN